VGLDEAAATALRDNPEINGVFSASMRDPDWSTLVG
jgi:hypothetical protein